MIDNSTSCYVCKKYEGTHYLANASVVLCRICPNCKIKFDRGQIRNSMFDSLIFKANEQAREYLRKVYGIEL